jgi:hypothetical protein
VKDRLVYLLFLAYVIGDLANPMMPGAFQFVDGSLDAVEAVAARADVLAQPALLPARAPAVEIRDEPEPPAPGLAPDRLIPRVPEIRRALARPSGPPPPTEDH